MRRTEPAENFGMINIYVFINMSKQIIISSTRTFWVCDGVEDVLDCNVTLNILRHWSNGCCCVRLHHILKRQDKRIQNFPIGVDLKYTH